MELGCTVESIVEQMVLRDFDHAYASAAVHILKNELNASYRYEETKPHIQGKVIKPKIATLESGFEWIGLALLSWTIC